MLEQRRNGACLAPLPQQSLPNTGSYSDWLDVQCLWGHASDTSIICALSFAQRKGWLTEPNGQDTEEHEISRDMLELARELGLVDAEPEEPPTSLHDNEVRPRHNGPYQRKTP